MNDNIIESAVKEKNSDKSGAKIDIVVLFGEFLRGFLRLGWLIVILALIFGSLNYYRDVSGYRPVYRSKTTFTVVTGFGDSMSDNSYNFYYDSGKAEQLGLTFPHILNSQLLTDAIKEDMGTDTVNATLSAQTISDSNMVTMSAESSVPSDAKKVLESAVRVYPDVARFVIGDIKFNIIESADFPVEPSNPVNYRVSFLKGQLIGVIIGLIILAAYVFLRKTVHYTEELEKEISIPCIVSLPIIKQKKRNKKTEYFPSILDKGVGPVFRENLEALRVRVEKEITDKNHNVIMITSTWEAEGKSLIAANLACLLAKHRKKVMFVDADLRKQNLVERLKVQNFTDFRDINYKDFNPSEVFKKDERTGVYILAGTEPFDNIPYFLTNNLLKIIKSSKQFFDYVIIDTPPSGDFEDTLIIKSYVNAVLYVVKQDYAPKTKILETITLLNSEKIKDKEDTKFIGYVFNGITGILGEYGYGKYGYGRYGYGKYGYGKYGYGRYGYGKYGYGKYGYGKYGYGKYGYGNYGYGAYGENEQAETES